MSSSQWHERAPLQGAAAAGGAGLGRRLGQGVWTLDVLGRLRGPRSYPRPGAGGGLCLEAVTRETSRESRGSGGRLQADGGWEAGASPRGSLRSGRPWVGKCALCAGHPGGQGPED